MNIYVKKSIQMNADLLKISAGVRYWEGATVNGQEDAEGSLIPFRNGDYWEPTINIETGTIKDWPDGITASIHYKVCDDGTYTITDRNGVVAIKKEGYVPDCLSPLEDGFGDYIILEVDEKGQINGWEADFSDFPDIISGEDE